ncbi:hypothetical protein COCSADRAFT_187889 [Bipolaris sorokiniana ND90Pr]|uniref:Beta-lactamase-related domain-containing protein n=1 Tax=Cochliobolus sativus (strain ND90Pr / ATCC 201652) TaxID=665912 RepID=M2TCS0_COCSN|nr:uncharacterized protein COCSADRAFT_187889 [Bipolaris sorokiniana ND90Pr]EMD67046.1 hypothetical protein COCSADRAFT_187889 [Bipolaris sorokiniana ND90Pr]
MSSAIDFVLQEAVRSGRFLGLSCIAIDKAGNTIYSGAHGRRSFNSDEPMTISTSGWLASTTKLMTAVAALRLVQENLVGLDADVADILPELREKEILISYDSTTKNATFVPRKKKITLRRLLSHSAGFTYPFITPMVANWSIDNGLSATIDHFTGDFKADWDRPMIFEPGNNWSYGPSIDWAGKVVEKVSGKSLEDYFNDVIWTPLGMKNTTFHPEKYEQYPLLEMGQRENGPGSKLVPDSHYAKFLAALLGDNGTLLRKGMIEELEKPQLNEEGKAALEEMRNLWLMPELPREVTVDHALGGLVTTSNFLGGRAAGAMAWDGISNPNWLIDRVNGVAMIFFTQVWATDPDTKGLWSKLEKELLSHEHTWANRFLENRLSSR